MHLATSIIVMSTTNNVIVHIDISFVRKSEVPKTTTGDFPSLYIILAIFGLCLAISENMPRLSLLAIK